MPQSASRKEKLELTELTVFLVVLISTNRFEFFNVFHSGNYASGWKNYVLVPYLTTAEHFFRTKTKRWFMRGREIQIILFGLEVLFFEAISGISWLDLFCPPEKEIRKCWNPSPWRPVTTQSYLTLTTPLRTNLRIWTRLKTTAISVQIIFLKMKPGMVTMYVCSTSLRTFLAADVNKVFAKVSKKISKVKMEKVCYKHRRLFCPRSSQY